LPARQLDRLFTHRPAFSHRELEHSLQSGGYTFDRPGGVEGEKPGASEFLL
jgi:hypothetical protein